MIRFQCPNCEKKLSVQDALAGRLAVCPGCKERVRIPAAEEEPEEQEEEAVSEKPRSRARPRDDEEEEERPRRPVRRRDEEEDAEEDDRPRRRRARDDDEEEEDEPRRRPKAGRKKKRRSRGTGIGSGLGMDPYALILIVVGGIGFLTLIAGLFVPLLLLIPAAIGSLAGLGSWIWILIIAFSDNTVQGILCLCPLYALIYGLMHMDTCQRPLTIWAIAIVLNVILRILIGVKFKDVADVNTTETCICRQSKADFMRPWTDAPRPVVG